jgi:hypothetical protein
MHRSRPLLGLILLGALLAAALGCREEVPPLFRRNRPPETTLTIVPEESTAAFYRYHVYWRGEDPDGEVVRYLFAITDTLANEEENRWDPELAVDVERGVFTAKTDSVFFFNSQAGRQAFNIVAIDDFGEKDPSPERAFFKVNNNGFPKIVYLDVPIDTNTPGVVPCASADPCTIPTFTDFQVRFTATTSNGRITGYTWQVPPNRWQPFGTDADTNFIALDNLDGHTIVEDEQGRPAWEISEGKDTVSVYLYSNRDEPIVPGGSFSGSLTMKARSRDDAQLLSSTSRGGERFITVNYDPDTWMFSVPECDCPNAPPGCSSQEQVPAGWVTGIGLQDSLGTVDDWRLFCQGDTIPNFSFVRFYAEGRDDPRDVPIDPQSAQLPEATFSFRFEFSGAAFADASMRLSRPRPASDLLRPAALGGGSFRGASADWQTCPFDYRFQAGAVDEHFRDDGTPAVVEFFVGGSPRIDSLRVPRVLVFVPACTQQRPTFCQDQNVPEHWRDGSRDTLAVFGTPEEDAFSPAEWKTAWGQGWNTFVIPFRVFGHDHPRDQNLPGGPQYYGPNDEGHIRAWKFSFDCVEPACEDHQLRGEDTWRPNIVPVGQGPVDVFDDVLVLETIPLDTLCVADEGGGCSFDNSRAALLFTRFGDYLFEIQGRDTEFIAQRCQQPESLDEEAELRSKPLSASGRTTQIVRQDVSWVQLRDVRSRPTKPTNATAGRRPFTNRKRLMR